ncbi:MAG: hypoxanthine phosphoribosyltransferase [Verrucomicrobiales bacterium]
MGVPRQYLHERLERVLFGQDEIRTRIAEMGTEITCDFAGSTLSVVTVLEGGALFMADLIREIHLPLRIDSISVDSYHGGIASSGTVCFRESRLPDVSGRDVLVLDDILDSGRTMAAVVRKLKEEGHPRSIKSAVLLSKRIERSVPFEADYSGFDTGDEFVVGYGLDYRGEYRNLAVIGTLKPEYIEMEACN